VTRPTVGSRWRSPDGVAACVVAIQDHEDLVPPEARKRERHGRRRYDPSYSVLVRSPGRLEWVCWYRWQSWRPV
jgi:hypothetical protein